ncbi:MAG: hypothetical protein HC840_22255 [Leptolyngbyaceae cyanobacterium RM2_2_4]|nr:hypothetical protein [Leptolyngbyaceae cyanobacterium SM1_4_3]NJN89267.1 hypothetical protein [Leptolyngbyaceae cyanobacterium SL_5_14]NJO51687.1 hypothetical protein [Leptolyngbyaceae cyanobacterium RM2_2_4]
MNTSGKQKKVLICGFYGNYNLGDEAMLSGMIQLLREQYQHLSFTVFSNDVKDTSQRYGVRAIDHLNRKQRLQRLLAIAQSQYFILGGGDLLRDSVLSSIAKTWLKPLQQAINLNCRTAVLGISVGEIWRDESKMLIPKVLNRVDLIAVRDNNSKQVLESLGVTQKIYVMSDLALQTLPKVAHERVHSFDQPPQVGISLRHLSLRGQSVNQDLYPTILKEVAAVADALVEKYGAVIHFLPLRTFADRYHNNDDDYVSALAAMRYSRYSSQFIVHRYFDSLSAFNDVISTLDLIVGMRLHSLILGAGIGVPVIGAEYDPKIRGFLEEINQANRCLSLEDFNQEKILTLAEDILTHGAKDRVQLQTGMQNYCTRLVETRKALHQFLN